jgi:GNAT superfamily N-acetyltransferase
MTLQEVPPGVVAALFAPERPGPLIQQHVAASGVGRCLADRGVDPRTALAELPGGNVACRGEPAAVPGLRGLVEAPPQWRPALESVAPVAVWERIIAVLPDDARPGPRHAVRRLASTDVAGLAALDPSIAWISETWGGHAGLAASGAAWVAVADGRPVAVATAFFVGTQHEDIGVVTEPGYRGRGLSTSCAAAVIADVRARGRRPTWTTSPENTGSRAVAARLGFVHARADVLYAVGVPIPVD